MEVRDALVRALNRLDDRIATTKVEYPVNQVDVLNELISAGEWGLALEQIADVLSEDEAGLRDDEREDLLALNGRLGMGERVSSALSLCPRLV